jgi:hypothetical protein
MFLLNADYRRREAKPNFHIEPNDQIFLKGEIGAKFENPTPASVSSCETLSHLKIEPNW